MELDTLTNKSNYKKLFLTYIIRYYMHPKQQKTGKMSQ